MTRPLFALLWLFACGAGAQERRSGPVILLDPGHGGAQEGAVGVSGALEKRLSLELAFRLKARLEKGLGATVKLSRERDVLVHLSDRVAWANAQAPELFLSLHANSMPTRRLRQTTQGIETYFLSADASGEDARNVANRENAESPRSLMPRKEDTLAYILQDLQRSDAHQDSSRLAYAVHQKLVEATGAEDRGVQQAPFFVLMGVSAPAVLVEVGFISHPDEGPRLSEPDYQETLATAIADGVKGFLEEQRTRGQKVARPSTP